MTPVPLLLALVFFSASPCDAPFGPEDYFRITVLDEETGRGVPLVELRTVNNIRRFTDSAGVVAFLEPGLMDADVYFHVSSHGYEYPRDGFGYSGVRLRVRPGGSAVLKIRRVNIAERLYRMTGAGIYRDSVLLGDTPPVQQPVLNAQVMGSDSVVNTVYRNRIYWFWGDTNRASYPLGNFHVPGAVSKLPGQGGLPPERGVDLHYFVDDDGFARPTAQLPGSGPTWIDGLVAVEDRSGTERLLARYVRIKPPLEVYERGIVSFNDEERRFGDAVTIPLNAPLQPQGHPLRHEFDGVEYVCFGHPFPHIRVPAVAEDVRDLNLYEAWTCLTDGSTPDDPHVDRTADGMLRYAWRRNTPPLAGRLRQSLLKQQVLAPDEGLVQLQDVETGDSVIAHGGSVYWNEFRRRWVAIILESHGSSLLGEIWYAEADHLLGPWLYARKIVTHDRYSFYNPKQHPMLDADEGRTIFFEGTYTHTFSGNPDQTPRYDYNQIMYKLDLSDERIVLPTPLYETTVAESGNRQSFATAHDLAVSERTDPPLWYALDRTSDSSVPVYWVHDDDGVQKLQATAEQPEPGWELAFHALPVDMPDAPKTTVPLREYISADGQQYRYAAASAAREPDGCRSTGRIVCRVWRAPQGKLLPPGPAPLAARQNTPAAE